MKQKITLQEILTGNILTRKWFRQQYRLFVLIAGFIFVYIYFGFLAQKQHRRLAEIQDQIEDASFEQLTIQAELTSVTRQSAVASELEKRGSKLKELTKPVVKIE